MTLDTSAATRMRAHTRISGTMFAPMRRSDAKQPAAVPETSPAFRSSVSPCLQARALWAVDGHRISALRQTMPKRKPSWRK